MLSKKAVQWMGLGLAMVLMAGCVSQPGESAATGKTTATAGQSTEAAATQEGVSTTSAMTSERPETKAASTATKKRTNPAVSPAATTKKAADKTTAKQTAAIPAATTTAPAKTGHISKSDTSVEPVRSLSQILSSLGTAALSCDAYDLDKYLKPYWSGNIVYNESLSFVKDTNGKASAPLLYDAVKILSVKDSALNITYREGVDYTYADGVLTLTAESAIPCFAYDDIYFANEKKGASYPLKAGGYTYFAEGTYFHSRQVAVTYLHSEPWKGYKPAYQEAMIPHVIQKLKKGENVSIVFLGDSITKGGNASGMFGAAPKMPIWADKVTAMLKKAYPKAQINSYNASNNGATAPQALQFLRDLCSDHKPDLVIIGFGMNDGTDANYTPEVFQTNIRALMEMNDALTKKQCDYLLLSTTLPNPEIKLGSAYYHEQYAEKLYELERVGKVNGGVGEGGVVVGDMTAIHKVLLSHKRFFDMTANNVNHANDFLARAYAQLICSMLISK